MKYQAAGYYRDMLQSRVDRLIMFLDLRAPTVLVEREMALIDQARAGLDDQERQNKTGVRVAM